MLKNIWNFLIVNENPKQSDVIIVLSGDKGRLEYAVKLYQQGFANRLLLTGNIDAGIMGRRARSLGVPPGNIIVDIRSYTTRLNARHSLAIMRSQGFHSAIVVTSPYHTKRARLIFDRLSDGLDITMCSVPYNSSASRNWWKNSHTARRVIAEYPKFVLFYLRDR